MAEESAERSEKPTPQRRERARKEGQLPVSSEVGVVAAALSLCIAIGLVLPLTAARQLEIFEELVRVSGTTTLTIPSAARSLENMALRVGETVGPMVLVSLMLGILASVAQVGFHMSWESVELKWERLDPRNWLRRVASVDLPTSLLKSLLKGLGVVLVAVGGVVELPEEIGDLVNAAPAMLLARLREVALDVTGRVVAALAAIALLDVVYTRFRHEQKLMMSRQEIRDELKDSEGNPQVRGAMRRRMKEVANRRLKTQVSQATVVTTNPTHYAVALRYWRGQDQSPVVVAKGVDFRAQRIKAYAKELGIPIIEDKPLARALHALVQEGQNVPFELYRSVARLLAIVYRRRGYINKGTES